MLELRAAGLTVAQQRGVTVEYKGAVVGEYFANLVVEDVLLVELKTAKTLEDAHRMQCTNYLKATGPRRTIRVFGVHLPSSAFKPFLSCGATR